jgi:hypothetical protein
VFSIRYDTGEQLMTVNAGFCNRAQTAFMHDVMCGPGCMAAGLCSMQHPFNQEEA